MADLRTLLHDAAPTPRGPLDLDAVRRRAGRLGVRRAVAWVAGLGAVIGLGVPVAGGVGGLLVPADDRPTASRTASSRRTAVPRRSGARPP